jgi:DNA-binding LytR/AlgR family response regulator
VRRLPTAVWVWAFLIYSYLATTGSAAWFARQAARDAGAPISLARSLIWQGASYGVWIAVAGLVWIIIKRLGPSGRGVATLWIAGMIVAPLVSLTLVAIDLPFRGEAIDLGALPIRALWRLPVAILLYTAIAAVGLAAAHRQREVEARARIDDLEAGLAAARAALDRANDNGPTTLERLMVSTGSRRVPVSLAQVEWFAAAGNYVVVHWGQEGAEREGLVRETLQGLEARLDPAVFARGHRSTLVNLARVRETQSLSDGSWRLTLESGAELVVSRTYRDALLERLGRQAF